MFTCPGCGVEATTDARHRDGCTHETALYLKSAAGKADEIGRAARDLADAAPETPDSGAPEPEQARSAHDEKQWGDVAPYQEILEEAQKARDIGMALAALTHALCAIGLDICAIRDAIAAASPTDGEETT